MNKRKVTKRKGSKVKANSSEVFVLPPDLLEALGIHLGTIETAPECTSGNQVSEKELIPIEKRASQGTSCNLSENKFATDSEKELSLTKSAGKDLISKVKGTVQGTPDNIPENKFTTSSEKESSIIQTANLMTASVFLSPTFISNDKSIIGGEVEIVENAKLVDEAISKPNVYFEKNECDQSDNIIQGVLFPNQHQDAFSVSSLESSAQRFEAIQEINKDFQSTDVHVEINNLAKDINSDDHADEAYSSDGSNANVEMNDKSDGSNGSVLPLTNNIKKISIISEQILDPSQFKIFQSSCSAEKNRIPVAMNTVLESSNCYQRSINSNNDLELGTYYVAPSDTTNDDLCDLNENNSVCEFINDPNEAENENDYMNQNAATCDSLDNYFANNNLSNVSEDIIMDIVQESSSQHEFKIYKSDFDTHLVIADTFNCEDKGNIMETNISDTKNTNTSETNYAEEKVNETLQKVDPDALHLPNTHINCIILPSVSEDAAVSTQMQESSTQHAFQEHNSMFDSQLVLDGTFNRDDNDNTTETNNAETKNTNTIMKKFEVERVNGTSQKVNQKALDEQKFYDNYNALSNLGEVVGISTTKLEGSYPQQHAFNVYKREYDTHVVLPDTLNCISNTKKIITIEEQEIDETLQKVGPNAINEHNINFDNKHQELSTEAAPYKANSKLTNIKDNTRKDSKRKRNDFFVEGSKTNRDRKHHLSQNINSNQDRPETNVKKEKLKDKVQHIKVIKKVLKHTRNKTTNLEINEMLVDGQAKPSQQFAEELHECNVPDNNSTIIQCNSESFSNTKADRSAQLNRFGVGNDDQEDKIREIAGYLSKFAELQKRRKILKEKQQILSIKTFTNKKHATNTKLSIQGVEKPGGLGKGKDRKNDKKIKTYERKTKNGPPVKVLLKPPNFDTLTQKIDLLENSSYNTLNDTDLCLCDDFGRLKYYDDESMYEHIHFWNRKGADCTPDIIFSIYSENISVEINTDDDMKHLENHSYIPTEIYPAPNHKICWKDINFMNSQVCDEKDSEHIVTNSHEDVETSLLNVDKPSESSVDEQKKSDAYKCSPSQAKHNENLQKAMVSENCQETIISNIVPDLNSMKNEKKRKYSSTFNGSDKSPAPQSLSDGQIPDCVKNDTIAKKQKSSNNEHAGKIIHSDQPNSEGDFAISLNNVTSVVCGVCRQNIKDIDWLKHTASQHNYLSWRVDEAPLDLKNRQFLIQHLSTLIKQFGELTCNNCGTTRKYAKPFLHHINQCTAVEEFQSESALTSSSDFGSKTNLVNRGSSSILHVGVSKEPEPVTLVECGVCGESIQDKYWNSHIGSQHNYLAWKHGEQTLDVDNEDEVKEHLYNITKEYGGLKCAHCGLTRKYVKSYLTHIKSCDGQAVSESLNESTPHSSLHIVSEVEPVTCVSDPMNDISFENGAEVVTDDLIKCGVCGEFMHSKDWNRHIGSQHNYLAWKHGEPTLDVDDEAAVKEHLYNMTREFGGLECAKCGLTRKYVKSYLTHIRNCDRLSESITGCAVNALSDVSEIEATQHVSDLVSNISTENEVDTTTNDVKCAVCGESMLLNDWYEHMGLKHHYLAWRCGDPALDLNDEEATHQHLQAITKEYGGLKCVKCGLNRKYVKSYLAHVKGCIGPKAKDDNPIADDSTPTIVVLSEAEQHAGLIKCGVCGQYMPLSDWSAHMVKHNYIAWKDDEPPLDINDKAEVREHLKNILKEIGILVCPKCGIQRKFAKSYTKHIQKCDGSGEAVNCSKVTDEVIWPAAGADQVKCGACHELIQASLWIKHIAKQHDYLAKKDGETPLDVDDDEEVYKHLNNIVKENGSLVCQKCGTERKYVKSYLEHIKKCGQDLSATEDTFEANTTLDTSDSLVDFYSGGVCGVCEKEVETGKWIQHIQKEHNYLAWRQGEKPWNTEDFTEVNDNLYEISKKMGGLTCNKCGLVRKYVKSYLTHIKSCTVVDFNLASIVPEGVGPVSDTAYRCAMCQKEIEPSKWKEHAMKEHYNITWIIGETPIDIKNPYAVEKYLKEYKQYRSLKCNNCGATRASFAGFYAHIITCGKTEEQIEMFQSVCDICKNKYLCIYKNQHMMIHRVQEYSKELKMAKESKVPKKEEPVTSGKKRRAAQKARTVIETYSSDMSQHKHKCSTCGFGTDYEEELQSHRCDQNEKDFSEEESSAAEGEGGEDESDDSEVDSDISREEEEEQATLKKKRYKEPGSGCPKLSKIYFKVEDPNAFVEQSDIDFCKAFYTDDTLFTKWLYCESEVVSETDLPKYLPPLEESCKVKAGFDWTTLKRFEAKSGDGTSIFIGGCIVCIAWIPLRVEDIMGDGQNFLAVASHNDVDCPRYQWDETSQHENLIQIWDFGTCEELPRIVYGIAHDFGTVWSMDWCPSGARNVLPEDLADGQFCRLGLLAVACSNGSAYIFSVPHPSAVVKDHQIIHKLRPVAELRMKMLAERSHKTVFQATSVTWSKQKGHEVILVGYADGSTGYFDINSTSPLARRIEDNIEIFFPYSQERPHNTCITATDIWPRQWGGFAACSGSATGAEMCVAGSGARARVRSSLPARAAIFAPHWPATLLAGDVAIMKAAVNELEWTAPARKLGGVRALAGCARCGRVAAAAPPALRTMRPHPAYPEFKKPIFGMLEMIPLAKQRTKQVNDELGMKIEPLTYSDAISKYGIRFQSISVRDKTLQQKCAAKPKVHFPERFPLADVESMAFCPTKRHHDKLAVATHSGIVFFTTVNS